MFKKKKTIIIKKNTAILPKSIEEYENELSEKTGFNVVVIDSKDEVIVVD